MELTGKKMVITIKRNGEIKKDVVGFKGGDCFMFTNWFDSLMGEPDEQKFKDSYYEESEVLTTGLPSGLCG